MGLLCCFSHSADAHSLSLEVQADADTMWSILSDLEASADAVAAVKDFAFLQRDKKSKFEVGTTVRETRVYKAGEFVCRRQIVAIVCDDDSPARSVSFSTSLEPETSTSFSQGFSNTSTLTVVPLTETTCELVGSMAVTWTGIISNCWACCWKCVNGSADSPFAVELENLASGAEEKFKSNNNRG